MRFRDGPGRPALPPGAARVHEVKVRFDDEIRAILAAVARETGKPVATLVAEIVRRQMLLDVRQPSQTIATLRQITRGEK